MPSIFSRIIAGEIPCHKIGETKQCFAFLDINPLRKGHVLVVPKIEVDRLFELDEENYQALFTYTKQVAKAIKTAFPCDRVGMAVIGLEVPHAHIHLVPIDHMADIDFTRPKMKLSHEELSNIAQKIATAL